MTTRTKPAATRPEIALVVDRLIEIDGTVVAEVVVDRLSTSYTTADRLVEFLSPGSVRLAIGALAGEHRETRTHGRLSTSGRFGRTTMRIIETETLVRTYLRSPVAFRAVVDIKDARLTNPGTKVPVLGLNLDVLA